MARRASKTRALLTCVEEIKGPALSVKLQVEQKRPLVWTVCFVELVLNGTDLTNLCRRIDLSSVKGTFSLAPKGSIFVFNEYFHDLDSLISIIEGCLSGNRGRVILRLKDGSVIQVEGEEVTFRELFGEGRT